MKAFDAEAEPAAAAAATPAKSNTSSSVQAKQLSEAMEKGLLVDVARNTTDVSPATLVSQPDIASPQKQGVMDELGEWDKARDNDNEFFLDEEDSDDDLI